MCSTEDPLGRLRRPEVVVIDHVKLSISSSTDSPSGPVVTRGIDVLLVECPWMDVQVFIDLQDLAQHTRCPAGLSLGYLERTHLLRYLRVSKVTLRPNFCARFVQSMTP